MRYDLNKIVYNFYYNPIRHDQFYQLRYSSTPYEYEQKLMSFSLEN